MLPNKLTLTDDKSSSSTDLLTHEDKIRAKLLTSWGKKAADFFFKKDTSDYWTPYNPYQDQVHYNKEKKDIIMQFHFAFASAKIKENDAELKNLLSDLSHFDIAITSMTLTADYPSQSPWHWLIENKAGSLQKYASILGISTNTLKEIADETKIKKEVISTLFAKDNGESLKIKLAEAKTMGIRLDEIRTYGDELGLFDTLIRAPNYGLDEKLRILIGSGLTLNSEDAEHLFGSVCQDCPTNTKLLEEILKHCRSDIIQGIKTKYFKYGEPVLMSPLYLILKELKKEADSKKNDKIYDQYLASIQLLIKKGCKLDLSVKRQITQWQDEPGLDCILNELLKDNSLSQLDRLNLEEKNKRIQKITNDRKKEHDKCENERIKQFLNSHYGSSISNHSGYTPTTIAADNKKNEVPMYEVKRMLDKINAAAKDEKFKEKVSEFKKTFLTWPPLVALFQSERKSVIEFYETVLNQNTAASQHQSVKK